MGFKNGLRGKIRQICWGGKIRQIGWEVSRKDWGVKMGEIVGGLEKKLGNKSGGGGTCRERRKNVSGWVKSKMKLGEKVGVFRKGCGC